MKYLNATILGEAAVHLFGGQGSFFPGQRFFDSEFDINDKPNGTLCIVERATQKSWVLSAGQWSGEPASISRGPGRPRKDAEAAG